MLKTFEDGEKVDPVSVRSDSLEEGSIVDRDERRLNAMGYKQEFKRGLSIFENWAASYIARAFPRALAEYLLISINIVCGIPVLFGFVLSTGGPAAAFANWTMAGGLATVCALSMAEIAAAYPTAGGIYYWSFHMGGSEWGPFLAWMTGWWNWVGWVTLIPGCQSGGTNFLLSALEILYPNLEVLHQGWLSWCMTTAGLLLALIPTVINQQVVKYYFRFAMVAFHVLLGCYWIWLPIKAAQGKGFQSAQFVFQETYNGVNLGPEKQASDAYSWLVSLLFGAWVFYGYDASVHVSEETKNASDVVAKGMYLSMFSAWAVSVPTLVLVLFCIQDFKGIISASYANNWAKYLVQIIGARGAVGILCLLWVVTLCSSVACILSAQRVTYALSRDGLLPKTFSIVQRGNQTHAAYLVVTLGIIITTAVIGSQVAFGALTATATIATNTSYIFPIVARQTVGRKRFEPARWNLGRWSTPAAIVAASYICFQFVVLLLPQEYPVTAQTLNYAPIMIGFVTIASLAGWWLPRWGGRVWFAGPRKTV